MSNANKGFSEKERRIIVRSRDKMFVLRILVVLAYGMVFGSFASMSDQALAASVPDIKIAMVYPLSGAYSRTGNLTVPGMKAAMGWVNDNGGIKSMGGAKLVPVVADGGSTVEATASTFERVCKDPSIVIAFGPGPSSLTLAGTQVTERLGIPHFSGSYSDALNTRGFKWGFYVTVPGSSQMELGFPKLMELARSVGSEPKTAMIVGDNSSSAKAYYDTAKRILPTQGIKIIGEETWSAGTLSDATQVMQKVKNSNPDIVLFHASAMSEAQMCLMKKKEFDIRIPFISFGGYAADASFRSIGADVLDGLIAITGAFPHRLTPEDWIKRTLEQCRKDYSDEPWVGQEPTMAWLKVPILAEILERAGSRDRNAIRETAIKLDIHDVMATRQTVMQGFAFGQDQRLAKKYQGVQFVQWQGGVPRTVYPANLAVAKPKWGSR
jgi:branched-chain amino acid transport system substrate-binding protein